MARSKVRGDVAYFKPQRLWSKKAFLGYKAWEEVRNYPPGYVYYMQEQIRQDTGEFKAVEKRGKTIYYRRIEQPSKKDTMICGERPIAYSTKGDYLWFSEAYNNCDSWEELRMVLEFSHSKELLSVVDAYVKCGAEYNEVIFETEPRSEKEWWALYKEEMREHYDCVKAGRVSRYI